MRIDAHQHFWRLDRGDYGWLTPDLAPIHRDFLPSDLEPLCAAAGVERTVLIQAAPTEAETLFLLDLAERTPMVAGVVGWTDLEAPEAPERITALAERPGLRGVRPMVQDIADIDWLRRPALDPAIAAMQSAGLRFDALVKPAHLPALLAFVRRHPDLPIVIDHAGKPDIAGGEHEAWARAIVALSREPNVACKLSGLLTEAAPGAGAAELRPYVETLIDAFGPGRLMWGSDWPVLNLAGDYAGWRGLAETLLADLSEAERDQVFGETAAAFYAV